MARSCLPSAWIAESGKILHDIKVFDVARPAFCHPFNSYASSTPVVEQGRLYAHFGAAALPAWIRNRQGPVGATRSLCDHFRGPASSPTLHGQLLMLIFDGFDQQYVVALDKDTGKTVWKTDRNIDYKGANGDLKKAYATPAVFTIEGKPQMICPSWRPPSPITPAAELAPSFMAV